MPKTKTAYLLEKIIGCIELSIGVLLPWRLRCKYSELLTRLSGEFPEMCEFPRRDKKERDFEKFLHLGRAYFEEKDYDSAIDNLNKAIETKLDHKKILFVRLTLLKCYRAKGETDKLEQTMVSIVESRKKTR